jgi:ABC-type proline/glycine betaine transport system permease subunit
MCRIFLTACFIVIWCVPFHVFSKLYRHYQSAAYTLTSGLNSIISVMNIVYWMITKFVIFRVWKFLSINKQITFECVHFYSIICSYFHTPNMTNLVIIQYTIFMTLIIEFNLGIKLNTEMVKILSKLSFTVVCWKLKLYYNIKS